MSKEIMDDYDAGFKKGQHDLNRIVALKEDLAYEKGLLAGYTKSICLVRHLQRTLVVGNSARYAHTGGQREILEKAMELISEKLE